MSGPSGDVHDQGDFNFRTFFVDIPPVTRTMWMVLFFSTVLSGLGILPLDLFYLDWIAVTKHFQIWRILFTFFHAGKLGLGFLIRMYFFYTYSKQLEVGVFFNRPANYAWFITFVSLCILAGSAVLPSPINGGGLLTAIIHLWGRHATNVTVSLYGFIQIPAKYLSLAMLALDLIISGGIAMSDILGLIGGHLYYFLDSVYPTMEQGRQLMFVPQWFERLYASLETALSNVTGLYSGPPPPPPGPAPRRGTYDLRSMPAGSSNPRAGSASSSGWTSGFTSPTQRTGSHNWGSGRTLGS